VAGDETVWSVGAGLPTPVLARQTAAAGLAGVHRLVGVPGSVGGGIYMNAGAHGQDFSQVARAVDLVQPDGALARVSAQAIPWEYRSSGLGDRIVVGGVLAFVPGEPGDLEQEIRRLFKWRKAGTPFNEPCCGSVFRNPVPSGHAAEARTAGQLVDALGLKGYTVGGAQVSSKHANYIVNTGKATASDVLAVIEHVRERVLQEFGIELTLEVKVVQ
jgi:UDP-N-acetylmuramate dehydrogenase